MTRPPISKLREDVLRAAINYHRRLVLDEGSIIAKREAIAAFNKACAALAEREKGKK